MRSPRLEGLNPGARGFTLIELAVVLALLGAVLLVALPRLSIFEEALLRSDARKVASLIRRLDDKAASSKAYYQMAFDMGGRRIEARKSLDGVVFESPEDIPSTVTLGQSTGIKAVVLSGALRSEGRGTVLFGPSGAEPFTISLEASGFSCTVSYNPYSGKVSII